MKPRSPEPPLEAPSAHRPRHYGCAARRRGPGRPKGARVAGRSKAESLYRVEHGATLPHSDVPTIATLFANSSIPQKRLVKTWEVRTIEWRRSASET